MILGVGNGWIREEAEILGYPFERKVAKTNEHIEALKVLWTEEQPSYAGEFVSFPPVHSNPKPHQRPHPPIVIGSGGATTDNSRVLKRVARLADGWLPLDIGPEQMAKELAELRRLCEENGRSFDALDISLILASPALGIDSASGQKKSAKAEDLAGQYAEAGVGRIVVLPWGLSTSAALDFQSMEMLAAGLGSNPPPRSPTRAISARVCARSGTASWARHRSIRCRARADRRSGHWATRRPVHPTRHADETCRLSRS